MMKYVLYIHSKSPWKTKLVIEINSNKPEMGNRKFILYHKYNQPPELSIGGEVVI